MKTKLETLIEKRSCVYSHASNRAFDLMLRSRGAKFEEAYLLYQKLLAKFKAYEEIRYAMYSDPVVTAWHRLGDAWIEAYEELRG